MPEDKSAKALEFKELLYRLRDAEGFEAMELADRIYELGMEVLVRKGEPAQPPQVPEPQAAGAR